MLKTFDKNELRKMALKKRASFSRDLSSEVLKKILNSKDFLEAKNIALYVPIKNEIDITAILNIKDKKFYLPRCKEDELEFALFDGFASLKTGNFNILEPQGEKINPEILDIIYVPALMANNKCYRLGYGKGYYDRFFRNNNLKAEKIIVLAKELVSDDFIEEEFDVPCDFIISA